MDKILEDYMGRSQKLMVVDWSLSEYEQLVVDVVSELADVNLKGLLSVSRLSNDSHRVATYVDRILLDPEEEERIDVLYENQTDYYMEPSQLPGTKVPGL